MDFYKYFNIRSKLVLLIVIYILTLSGCSEFNLCYYKDEFDSDSTSDQITLYANVDNCFYNTNEKHSKNTNETIKNCLKKETIQAIKDDFDYSENLKSKQINEKIDDIHCYSIDKHDIDSTKEVVTYKESKEKDFESSINEIYMNCVELCQNKCKNTSNSDSTAWKKAKLITDNSYAGIKISKDVYITITAIGSINLNASNRSDVIYNKNGEEEINSKFVANDGDTLDLNIEINSENIQNNKTFNSELDLIGRTYIDFLPIKTSLIVDDIDEKYSFQEPNYKAVKCKYGEKENRRNTAYCEFNYEDILLENNKINSTKINYLKDVLNKYYNTNYKTSVFYDGDFYKYSNDAMDGITCANDKDKCAIDDTFKGITKQTEGKNGIKAWDFNEYDGYFLVNYSGKQFSFKISKPSKIAIKILNQELGINCTYNITEKMEGSKLFESQNEVSIETKIEIKEYKKNENKWYVSKNDNEEIIYNKYSTISNPFKSTITIKANDLNTLPKCWSRVLIKIIPLKEIEIKETGYLSFHFPGFMNKKENISYMLLNPKVLEPTYTNQIDNINIKKDDLVKRFFENSTPYDKFDNVLQLILEKETGDDFIELNSNNLKKGYENNKYIFVRKGQVLRLDYKNWFTIDSLQKITIKTANNTENKIVDYGIGLNYFIVKREPYFCFKTASENIDKEFACKFNGGTYSNIKKESEGKVQEQGACYRKVENCMAKASLVSKLLKIDMTKENCTRTNDIDSESSKKNLVDFWNDTYSDYKSLNTRISNISDNCNKQDNKNSPNCEIIKNNNENCENLYKEIIKEIYNQVSICINTLGDNYQLFNEEKNSDGSFYKKQISDIKDIKENKKTETEKQIEDLKKLFKTEETIIENNYTNVEGKNEVSKSIIYNSSFYYYLSNYCNGSNTEGNICKLENIPQCYDFSNYVGNLIFLFEGLRANDTRLEEDDSIIANFGKLDKLSIMFGARKLDSFSKNTNSGLIKNFIAIPSENTKNTLITFNQTINTTGTNFLRFFVVNDSKSVDDFKKQNLKSIDWTNLEKNSNNSNSNKDSTNWVYKIILESLARYRNGDRLAIFIGKDSKEYNDNKVLDLNSSENVLHLVKYTKDIDSDSYRLDKNTKFKFNSEGVLESVRGNKGIDFSDINFPNGNNYLKNLGNKEQANIFFKIIDTDNKPENNSGSYGIRIKTVNKSESKIISYFRDFFNIVLSFIDGSQISLKNRNNGSLVSCPFTKENSKDKCYIYNEVFSDNNGNNCSKEDGSCYENCHDIGIGSDTSICKQYYDGKGFVKNIYKNFVNNPLYQFIAKLSLVLAITMYGIGYFFGLSGFTQSEIITKIIRFCFIYFMISANGWNFFNNYIVKFFKEGIDSILFLIASAFEVNLDSELSTALATGNYSDKSIIFSTCFENLKLIFSFPVLNKMLGLAFSSWFGLVYLYLVFTTVINYIVGVFSAIIMYLTSQIYMSLVFCFFPLVVLFMFFEKTKKTFDNWINLLIGFAGQQIFLVMTISFFNILIYNFIKSTFSYTVCWLGIFNINMAGLPLAAISFWKIPSSSATSGSLNTVDENMPSFYSIMSFYIIGILMSKFVTGATELGQNIFGGGINIASGTAGVANNALNKGGELLKGGMQEVGKKFYSGVADRLGGQAIKDYAKKQEDERKDKKAKRDDFIKAKNENSETAMKNYKGSKEYQQDLENKMKDPKNKGKSENKIKGALLREKQAEFNRNASIEATKKTYENEIQSMLNKEGNGKSYKNMNDEEKTEAAERYATDKGLISKKE